MNPSWVMVGVAMGGIIFQAGIGWAVLGRLKRMEEQTDANTLARTALAGRLDQHEWRITAHDTRLHTHDSQIDKLRGLK